MFVELHARSAFSFLEGASIPEELIGACAHFQMPAMAIMDRNGVYGAPRFHLAAKKAGVRAHIGSEITCTNGLSYPLLVETREGYKNLCRLVTRMKLRAPKGEGAATLDEIAEFSPGLICITRHPDERLLDIFGKHRLFGELQRHYDRDEEARNQAVITRAESLGIPVVATNGTSYATPEQRELLDVFTCVRNKVTLQTAGRLLARNSELHVKPPTEMARLFADHPEAIDRTLEISQRLQFTLSDLGYVFPRYPTPDGESMISFLRKRVDEGARLRYRPYHEKARLQIERELALIEKLGLEGYFLIVWDISRFCRENDILSQGRGSAANSAVCYALQITAVDPVGMELLFERFLSEERGEWPDIDIDLPSGDKREKAIQYVYQRFGKFGAAMTANVITYRGRSAAREVGKALGFEITSIEKLSSLVRAWEWKDPKDTTDRQFREAGFDAENPRVRKFRDLYRMAQDLPRHLGQHSGGMVICQSSLDSVVPLEPATMPGRVVVQWDKEDCADMGIIKVDLLGLGMMAVLEDTVKMVPESYHETVDLAHLPQDDPAVFEALQKADTIGMFQVESRAQMSSLPRMKPKKFYDVVVQVALIRPGPIVGKMVHPYLNRRQGREKPDCLHPSLEPVLRRTLGVPLFQEQLLRMAMIAAGFTGGEAEELRRAMGFKRSEKRMIDIEVKLRAGMNRNGITGQAQDDIVRSITSFALYGFPESHAASFALLAFASAYLKCHYLAAFTCALLNNQPMGFYSPAVLIKDAQRHGLRVLPVDVMHSDWLCTLVPGKGRDPHMRLGLRYARGLREESARTLMAARSERPFSSIDDLALRVRLRKDEINRLAEIGALNSIEQGHRRDALWQAQRAVLPVGPLLEPLEESGQASPLAAMTDEERLDSDYRGTGLTIGRHPMAWRRNEMNTLRVTRAIDLPSVPNGRLVRVAGSVIVRQRPGTAKGFVFLSMEDETGILNVIIQPDTFDRYKFEVLGERFLMIDGTLQHLDGVISVKAGRVSSLREGAAASSHDFH
jgi:error-prone DNA polymerase